ncbi:MAG: NADP-dependent oxidoreductase [Steroidobacteraceae bacterium]
MTGENHEVVLKHPVQTMPVATDLHIVARDMAYAAPPEGLLVRVIALSLDPFLGSRMRGRHMGEAAPAPGASLPGSAVAQVLSSNHPGFAPDDYIVAETGWTQFAAISAAGARKVDASLPLTSHLGVLGMPGLTAWAGVTQLADAHAGDVLTVDAAAGVVGGVAGQIVRALGGRAIGIAGGPEKCSLVTQRYGFDACIDHRRKDWVTALKEVVAAGPTIHFENVGLPVYEKVFPLLRNYARVILCGLTAHYHADGPPAVYPIGSIIAKRAAVMGLVVYDYFDRINEWLNLGSRWLREGKLVQVDDVAEGLINAPAHFERMLRGEHLGKALVRIGPDRI